MDALQLVVVGWLTGGSLIASSLLLLDSPSGVDRQSIQTLLMEIHPRVRKDAQDLLDKALSRPWLQKRHLAALRSRIAMMDAEARRDESEHAYRDLAGARGERSTQSAGSP